jgi:hypothetical protein
MSSVAGRCTGGWWRSRGVRSWDRCVRESGARYRQCGSTGALSRPVGIGLDCLYLGTCRAARETEAHSVSHPAQPGCIQNRTESGMVQVTLRSSFEPCMSRQPDGRARRTDVETRCDRRAVKGDEPHDCSCRCWVPPPYSPSLPAEHPPTWADRSLLQSPKRARSLEARTGIGRPMPWSSSTQPTLRSRNRLR